MFGLGFNKIENVTSSNGGSAHVDDIPEFDHQHQLEDSSICKYF